MSECVRLVAGVEPDDARLIARALLFTAGEECGGVDLGEFEDDERRWMVALGHELLAAADKVERAR